jgi:hypothetical protein
MAMPPHTWWEWHGGSGALKEAGMKITAQLGCGSTERHWKGFKGTLTKKKKSDGAREGESADGDKM